MGHRTRQSTVSRVLPFPSNRAAHERNCSAINFFRRRSAGTIAWQINTNRLSLDTNRSLSQSHLRRDSATRAPDMATQKRRQFRCAENEARPYDEEGTF